MDMYNFELEKLERLICKELSQITDRNEFSDGALNAAHKLTEMLEKVYKIYAIVDQMSNGNNFSQAGNWEARINGNFGRGMSYNENDSSYGGGYSGRHLVRAHMSRNGMGGRMSNRGMYSHDDAKGEMMEQLQEMYENALNDNMRESIRKCMDSVRNS